jgi:hypothetical protein
MSSSKRDEELGDADRRPKLDPHYVAGCGVGCAITFAVIAFGVYWILYSIGVGINGG